MSVMKERIVLERTITKENGQTVLHERKICGVLDADGVFRLRGYCEKRFFIQQESGEKPKNGRTAA